MQNRRYATFSPGLLPFFVRVYGIMWPTYPLTSYSSASASVSHSLHCARVLLEKNGRKAAEKTMQIQKKSSAFVYVCRRTMNEVGNKKPAHKLCVVFVYQRKLIAMHRVLCAETLAHKYTAVKMWHGAMRSARTDATTHCCDTMATTDFAHGLSEKTASEQESVYEIPLFKYLFSFASIVELKFSYAVSMFSLA